MLAGYNDSLFAAFSAWALYSFAKERWVSVAIFAGLCAGTCSQGALFVILIVAAMIAKKVSLRKGLVLAIVAEAGLLAFMAYCSVRYSNPLAFIDAEKFWNRRLTWPLHPIVWFVSSVVTGKHFPGSQVIVFTLSVIAAVLAVAACVGLVAWAKRGIVPVAVVVLAIALVLLDVSSGPFGRSPEAIPRFVMTVIPLYIVVPSAVRRLPSGRAWLLASAMLAAVFQMLFTLGYWFT